MLLIYLATLISLVACDPLLFKPKTPANVLCPDKQGTCPDYSTCCVLTSGKYGCCPLKQATCCDDHIHCCPQGYTCNVGAGTCNAGNGVTIPLSKKGPASPVVEDGVVCPGGAQTCPTGSTCCKLSTGGFGCCPLPKATCCADMVHCCPEGYKCDTGAGTCSQGLTSFMWKDLKQSKLRSRTTSSSKTIKPTDEKSGKKLKKGIHIAKGNKPKTLGKKDPNAKRLEKTSRKKGTLSTQHKIDLRLPDLEKKFDAKLTKTSTSLDDGVILKHAELTTSKIIRKVMKPKVKSPSYPSKPPSKKKKNTGLSGHSIKHKSLKKSGPLKIKQQSSTGTDTHKIRVRTSRVEDQEKFTLCNENTNQNCAFRLTIHSDLKTSKRKHASMFKSPGSELPKKEDLYGSTQTSKDCKANSHGSISKPHVCENKVLQTNSPVSSKETKSYEEPEVFDRNLRTTTSGKGVEKETLGKEVKKTSSSKGFKENYFNKEVKKGTLNKAVNVINPDKEAILASRNNGRPEPQVKIPPIKTPEVILKDPGPQIEGFKKRKLLWSLPDDEVIMYKVTPDNVICPDGASSCPTGSTCCQLLSGQYGCCPMVKAVCCSDHLHCCPSGTTCDVQTSSCLKSDGVTIPWLTKQPAKANENSAPEVPQQPEKSAVNDDIKCPDGTSTCPSDTTCCKLLSGYYGCCPYPNAICCSDHLHCCASTQTCDTEKGICKDGDLEVPWGIKLPAKGNTEENGVSKAAENIICPDKQGSCPSGSTCCKLTSGKYGCCPLEKATCCNDHIHCCPSGYSCDVAGGSCSPKSGLGEPVPWSMKTPTQPLEQIKCDASYSCPDGTTCCKMGSSWGCCPMPEAACCRDGAHCCPRGFHCSPSSQACFRLPNIAAMKSVELQEATSDIKDVKCEDQKSSCPDGTTCCKLATGQYGCCPYAKAICCNDHLHCCPSGYTCDTAQGTCKQSELSIPWAEKFPAKKAPTVAPIENNLGAVVCPDKKSQCQDGTTCCKLTTGVWGCCPLPEAVCCNDGQHCCPKGTKCNTAQGRCDSETNSLSISWDSIKRTEKMTVKSKATVKCQDSSECPQGSTCCQLASGKFGCCPLPNATCCADKVHCCPSGYTCDTKQATCTKAGSSLAMTWWSHAKTQATKPSSCCKNGGNNCCPSGSSCDEPTGQCVESIPWVEKVPALQKSIKTDAVMCADHVHECPEGSTCCKLVSGEWGCCPLPKAVCCKDGQHCCPSGYTCDTEHATCRSPKDIVSSFKLRP